MRKFIAAFFSLLVAAAIPSAETRERRPLPATELEKYGDAPAYLYRTDSSPGMLSQYGPFISYQVNVDANGQNLLGDAANEPSITIDLTNGNKMAIGWRQFNSVFSSFRQGGWAYTINGGTSWTFPGVLESNVFRSDPVLFSTNTGNFFYLSLIQNFQDDIWRSSNGGQFWTKVAPATGGDKQWFTIDNTSSTGYGFQYQSWNSQGNNYGGRQFTRSTDGGVTWMDPIDIPNIPSLGTLDVDSNGTLFIGGLNVLTGGFWCVRSTNAKNGAVIPTFDQSTPVDLGGQLDINEPINPEGLVGQLFLAIDRSATSTNNNIYMLASVLPDGAPSGSDVMFAKSTDGGATFAAPRRVNDDPINHEKWHWFGTMSVAPNGRIDSVWLDTRNATNNTDSQLFYSYSTDGGNTWSPNVAVSAFFNPFLGYPNQSKMGDYITIVSDNGGGNVAYTATFNREEDIYYVRVSPGLASQPQPTPTPIPTPSPTPTATATSTPTPTATATATAKPTATATVTPSATASATATATATATASATPTATSTATPTATSTPTATATATPTATPTPTPAQPVNLSTRMRVGTGDNIGIGGFIISGITPKHVIIRALGPSLTQSGVPNALADPVLELYHSGPAPIASNNNWRDTQEAAIKGTGIPPANDLEAAIDTTLTPGNYTAVVRGNNSGTGVALVEVYDLNEPAGRLANISTRALVQTGVDITIAGFILGNQNGADGIVIRGIGPSLASSGVNNPLPNPTLELRDRDGALLATNNDWQDDPAQAAKLSAAGLAPSHNLEAGIAVTLPPGTYTALLAGENNSTGIGLVEVYDLGQ
jgi:hypothetical protein